MTEIIANAPWALMTFALGAFTGLVVLIAYFARLGSRVSGVEKNIVGLRDEMRAGFAQVNAGFAQVNAGFAEVRIEFANVRAEFANVRAEIAEVNKNLSRMGERVAKVEGRVDGWFEANNMHGDEKPDNDE